MAEIGPLLIFIVGLSFASNLLAVERREGILPLLLLVFALWGICELGRVFDWNAGWWETAILLTTAYVAILISFAWRARRALLANLREAAAVRYFCGATF